MQSCATVIILNYNGRRWLPACLDALAAQRGAPDFSVLLVDNGSTDDSVAFVRDRHPRVGLIETGRNLGFAEGNNAGAQQATGDRLIFLNNDTVPEPDWLARLIGEADAHPAFALVTSRLVFMDDPSIVDSAGDGYFRAGGAFKHGHGAPASAFGASREVFGASGAAFLIRRAEFDALGGFDPRFFMNFEDVDLSYRARLFGLRVWYAASAVVRHAGSGSLGVASPAAVYYGQRNLEWVWIKNTPWPLLWRSLPAHAAYSAAGVLHYARSGRVWPALRGKLAALGALPAVLRDRRRVQSRRTASLPSLIAPMETRWLAAKRREKTFIASRARR
jgi:GT2 family glycosyltransferase